MKKRVEFIALLKDLTGLNRASAIVAFDALTAEVERLRGVIKTGAMGCCEEVKAIIIKERDDALAALSARQERGESKPDGIAVALNRLIDSAIEDGTLGRTDESMESLARRRDLEALIDSLRTDLARVTRERDSLRGRLKGATFPVPEVQPIAGVSVEDVRTLALWANASTPAKRALGQKVLSALAAKPEGREESARNDSECWLLGVKNRVVFLDIDGVLNNQTSLSQIGAQELAPELVGRLVRLIEETGALIVVSSVWRLAHFGRLAESAFGKYIIGRTDSIGQRRDSQILRWIAEHGPIEHWIAIDDERFDMTSLGDRLVKTSFQEGLTESAVEEALRKFSCASR